MHANISNIGTATHKYFNEMLQQTDILIPATNPQTHKQ